MNIRELLLSHRASAEFLNLTDLFMSDQKYINELVEIAVSDEKKQLPQYSTHILLHVARKNKDMVIEKYNTILDCFLTTNNSSVERNLLGVILCFELEEYKEGELLDKLMSILNNPNSKPGQINYTVKKLAQYLEKYPELKDELELSISFREEMNLNPGIREWSNWVLSKKKSRKGSIS